MSKTWVILLIAGVVLVGLFMLAAVAAFVFLPNLGASLTQPKGPVLVYEVDPTSLTPGQTVNMDSLLKAVHRRLNSRRNRLARIRVLDGQRIEVAIMDTSVAAKQRVERLLAAAGTLEFRILANTRDNKDIIDRAFADPSKTYYKDKSGQLEAWWVPVKTGQETSLRQASDIAVREKRKNGRPTTEVLVLNDLYNVTGAYLTKANAGVDYQGRPCIDFTFNRSGGQLFGELTGTHLPDELSGFSYRLAIILDGEAYSAPSIRSAIHDNGQITGSFTNEEVEFLEDVLNSGSMPARIRPVTEQSGGSVTPP
jgi:SecD/SecF fusion protein